VPLNMKGLAWLCTDRAPQMKVVRWRRSVKTRACDSLALHPSQPHITAENSKSTSAMPDRNC
jgi:hypothetical protein